MAKKKTAEATETSEYSIDVRKLSLTKEKYIEQLGQYLEEQIKATIAKDGGVLVITVPKETEKRTVRFRANKFLYQSGLKNSYKLVSWIGGKGNGYQILEK